MNKMNNNNNLNNKLNCNKMQSGFHHWILHNKAAVYTHFLQINYRADLVASWETAEETSLSTQHGTSTIIWSLQLGADGLADCGHVRLQHDRQETRHIHRHTGYSACTFPTEQIQILQSHFVKNKLQNVPRPF